uniref:Uncharacterized protein n=1 Tax=Timema bartmani TaxID=61472 RepID=A0A7R9I3L5_9NEOP|nr:unnamed protein product [Timema bartmani]
MRPCCLVLLSVALLQPTISGFEDSIQYEPDALCEYDLEELDELGDEYNPWNETLYEETEEEERAVPKKDEAKSMSISLLSKRTGDRRRRGPDDRLRWPYPRHPTPDDVHKVSSVLRPVTKLFRPRYEEEGRKYARDLKQKRLRSRLRVKPRNKGRGSRRRGVAWREGPQNWDQRSLGPQTWDQRSLDHDGFWTRRQNKTRDFNPDPLILNNLAYCYSDALDRSTTEVG